MSSNSKPIPETLSPVLVLADGSRATRHTFVETRSVLIKGPQGGYAYEHVYRCQETGAERRWGTSDRRVNVFARGGEEQAA